MKKILLTLIEKLEKNEYFPFDTHEPIVTNSRK
jgi:hypothetical protein